MGMVETDFQDFLIPASIRRSVKGERVKTWQGEGVVAMAIFWVAVNVCNSGNHAYVGVAGTMSWQPVVGTLPGVARA